MVRRIHVCIFSVVGSLLLAGNAFGDGLRADEAARIRGRSHYVVRHVPPKIRITRSVKQTFTTLPWRKPFDVEQFDPADPAIAISRRLADVLAPQFSSPDVQINAAALPNTLKRANEYAPMAP